MNIELYNRNFHSSRSKAKIWQRELGYQICLHFGIKSVIDFGCSIGAYLEGFKKAGAIIKGYEIAFRHSKEFTSQDILPFIRRGDITKPIRWHRVDCTMSIEVAEHIDPGGSEQFVDNLCLNSNRYILLTAAPPGQGGVGHINCRPYSYWISLIERQGFVYLDEQTKIIIGMAKEIKGVAKWIKKNVMFFESSKVIL